MVDPGRAGPRATGRCCPAARAPPAARRCCPRGRRSRTAARAAAPRSCQRPWWPTKHGRKVARACAVHGGLRLSAVKAPHPPVLGARPGRETASFPCRTHWHYYFLSGHEGGDNFWKSYHGVCLGSDKKERFSNDFGEKISGDISNFYSSRSPNPMPLSLHIDDYL